MGLYKLYSLRKTDAAYKETTQKIVTKHGIRKSILPKTLGKKKTKNNAQGELTL